MSGPKRADVQAALNTAQRAARESAAIIAATGRGEVGHLGRRLADVLKNADEVRAGLNAAKNDLAGIEHGGRDTDAARREVDAALAALDDATSGTATQSSSSREADDAEARAKTAYDEAQAEFDRAEKGMRGSGHHYLTNEMAWARTAKKKFEEAGRLAARAAELREASKKTSSAAIEKAESGMSGARHALGTAGSAVRAGQERARAAAEAQRIAEENRRAASHALSQARIALDALEPADVDKFAPGTRDGAAQRVATAGAALERGDFDGVHGAIDGLESELAALAARCTEARLRWEAERAAALTARAELDAALEATNADLVKKWAKDENAVESSSAAAAQADRLIAEEDFDGATAVAIGARNALTAATESAALAKSQDVRRLGIGDAIMDVLEELALEATVQRGSRDQPLRIAGQTATPDGRGDIDIEIPLTGEVHFEVTSTEGDASCVAAVKSLQDLLRKRGVEWTTTDWGHATGREGGAGQKQREKTQTKERSKG